MQNSLRKKLSIFKVPIILGLGIFLLISLNSRIYRENIEDFKEEYIKAEEDYNTLALENDKEKERKDSYMELKKKYDQLNAEYAHYQKNTSETLDKKIADLKNEIGE